MSLSDPFLRRPVATTLLAVALALTGGLAYFLLPVSPLPEVDFPTITVTTVLPGASPETMASAVATPLERQFGRIAGITEMTATNFLGVSTITLQFDLGRNVDAAAREVQAAINAARGDLPANLPNSPNYRKVNPADFPIMILTLTSDTQDRGQMYDVASTVLQQRLAQVEGVGQVNVGGASLPGVRIAVNPSALAKMGVSLAQVRATVAGANANSPKGSFEDGERTWSIAADDALFTAAQYRQLIVAMKENKPIRLGEVAEVVDAVEDRRNSTYLSGRPGINLDIRRQPGANIIATVDRIKALIPELKSLAPASMKITIWVDQTVTIRASVNEIQKALLVSIGLVILVVFVFLRSLRATLIPAVVVPVSLVGTFALMYAFGFSLNNLSLMALTLATCFLVDDAIVVIENITRYLEAGYTPLQAARRGAREIGFTVLTVSTSLVVVFIPILLMGGIIGRLFREFAVTLCAAVAISLVVSLTLTPVLCSRLLRPSGIERRGVLHRFGENVFERLQVAYAMSLKVVLRHSRLALFGTAAVVVLNVQLFVSIPKGFFPQQDTGRIQGTLLGDQSSSFQVMDQRVLKAVTLVKDDPAVGSVLGQTGQWAGSGGVGNGSAMNNGRMSLTLKSLRERKGVTADEVIARLRPQLAKEPGATPLLQSVQDIRMGARQATAQFQYTLSGDNIDDLLEWAPVLLAKLRTLPELTDVNSDQQTRGQQQFLRFDRDSGARLGITMRDFDHALYDAFGQRSVSTMYATLNQYRVVMEVSPSLTESPDSLGEVHVRTSSGELVPITSVAKVITRSAPLSVNHQGQFPAITLSFNLAPGASLGDAVAKVAAAEREILMPPTVRGSFQGTAAAFQASLATQPLLILAALLLVYIVLGVLYESYLHPVTILSTLPSAGLGAVLALQATGMDLNVIAMVGVLLLIGLVQKNAIIMIDFALAGERVHGKTPEQAIFDASRLRFRPILMTTVASLLGALPLALGTDTGSELRRPLGIAVVGGLLVSQVLTLYTTPVIYLALERLRLRQPWPEASKTRAAWTGAEASDAT